MDIEQLRQIIKSNLITYGLQPNEIEQITEQLQQDILDLLNHEGENNDRS